MWKPIACSSPGLSLRLLPLFPSTPFSCEGLFRHGNPCRDERGVRDAEGGALLSAVIGYLYGAGVEPLQVHGIGDAAGPFCRPFGLVPSLGRDISATVVHGNVDLGGLLDPERKPLGGLIGACRETTTHCMAFSSRGNVLNSYFVPGSAARRALPGSSTSICRGPPMAPSLAITLRSMPHISFRSPRCFS